MAHLPENSKVIIDAANTVYIDFDVLELIRDFLDFGSKDKNITVTLRNFKEAYKMADAVHVHSEKNGTPVGIGTTEPKKVLEIQNN